MPMPNLYNINVAALEVLPTPEEIKQRLPLSETAANAVFQARETIKRILDRQDPRLFAVVGPCSIHDVVAARDYARRLKALADEVQDTLFLVMRVYFEKPRTTVGWKGLINDPRMDDTFRIDEGLQVARDLLLELAELGLPAGTEALDPIIPQYIHDLIAWTAIGARTTESQTHREIASGLSTPVGFKNGTNGSLEVAINALQSVASPHSFLGINQFGQSAVIRTLGNRYGHMVLRGGDRPNYDSVSIALCEKALRDEIAGQHRGRLQSCQLLQGPGHATAGDAGLRASDHGRQSFHRRGDDRKQSGRGQPVHPRRSEPAQIWRVGHRCLRGLGNHGNHAARGPCQAEGRAAGPARDLRSPARARPRPRYPVFTPNLKFPASVRLAALSSWQAPRLELCYPQIEPIQY